MKKSKFITIIFAFTFCICSLVVGIWAASSAKMKAMGTISFQAVGIVAEVSGSITGTNKINGEVKSSAMLKTLVFDNNNNGTPKENQNENLKWDSNALAFDENGSPITINFNIKNLSSVKNMYVKLVDKKYGNVENLTTKILKGEQLEDSCIATIEPGQSCDFKVIFSPTHLGKEINENALFDIQILLNKNFIKEIDSNNIYSENGNYYVNIGKFPQRFAGVKTNPTGVESLNDTTNKITLLGTKLNALNTTDNSCVYDIKKDTLTGREYVFVQDLITPFNDSYKYENQAVISYSDSAWFELESIRWIVLGYSYTHETNGQTYVDRYSANFNPKDNSLLDMKLNLICENLLIASQYDDNSFNWLDSVNGNCNIQTWLNADNGFLNSFNSNVKVNQLSVFSAEDSSKVWILSYDASQNSSNFANAESKKAKLSDFALAHYAESQNGFGWWWTKSSSNTGYIVNFDGQTTSQNDYTLMQGCIRPVINLNV